MLGITTCLCFPGQLNSDLRKLAINMGQFLIYDIQLVFFFYPNPLILTYYSYFPGNSTFAMSTLYDQFHTFDPLQKPTVPCCDCPQAHPADV